MAAIACWSYKKKKIYRTKKMRLFECFYRLHTVNKNRYYLFCVLPLTAPSHSQILPTNEFALSIREKSLCFTFHLYVFINVDAIVRTDISKHIGIINLENYFIDKDFFQSPVMGEGALAEFT